MLLVCMITVMVNYGIRNGPKTQICPSTGMAWDSVLETARLFYTETNPQKKEKKSVREQKHNRWPIHCQSGMLLRQIYSILVFMFTQSLAPRTRNTYAYTQKKRLVTTPKGILVRPCSWSRCVVTLLAEPKGAPVPSRTHMHTRRKTFVLHPEEVQCVSECMLEGRGRIKQLLKKKKKWLWDVKDAASFVEYFQTAVYNELKNINRYGRLRGQKI